MQARPLTNPAPDIVLIGPTGVGKSTIAHLLAQHFQIPRITIDEIAGPYFAERGLNYELYQKIEQEQGFFAAYRHWWPAYAYVVERMLDEHPHGILDLGAAHTHYEDPDLFARVQQLLAPYEHVILLLPSPDLDQSVGILRERSAQQQGWEWRVEEYDFIEHWVKDHCNYDLATLTVYTDGKTPEQTRDEILSRIKRST
jgi:ABC-type arginine transport system ATPase subunit